MANKFSKVFALIKQANANGLQVDRAELILDITNQRTSSLRDINHIELRQLEGSLYKMISKQPFQASEEEVKRDNMRKAVISNFKSVGKKTEDAIKWAEKMGALGNKKRFNDYNEQELFQLIKNSEKMKLQFIKKASS